MAIYSVAVLILLVQVFAINTEEVPGIRQLIASCKSEKSPEAVVECGKRSFQAGGEQLLKHGDPSINLPPIEPLEIDRLEFKEGNGQVKLDAIFTNIKLDGVSKFNIEDLKVDYNAKRMLLKFSIPKIHLTSLYEMQGTVFILPIMGTGDVWADIDDVVITLHSKMDVKDNHLVFEYDNVEFEYRDVKMRLNNLFNNDPILGETLNTFINENAREIIDQLKPGMIMKVSAIFESRHNQVFSNIDADKIPGIQYLTKV